MSDITATLRRAFNLGQTYWRQADSDSYKQNALSDETLNTFNELVRDTADDLASMRASRDALAVALTDYMQAVAQMNAAMKDGINVQGAVSALIGCEDNANAALAQHAAKGEAS
jgi:cysteinyl-tRNA synthetase